MILPCVNCQVGSILLSRFKRLVLRQTIYVICYNDENLIINSEQSDNDEKVRSDSRIPI